MACNLICRLPQPMQFLARLPELVKPRGQLFITTPFYLVRAVYAQRLIGLIPMRRILLWFEQCFESSFQTFKTVGYAFFNS